MWYFSWVLGLGLACSFAILNAMWLEIEEARERRGAFRENPRGNP
jgi:cyd operon protein YbgT